MVFAELANRTDVWKKGLEDWNVKQSQIANEWRTEGRAEAKQEDILEFLEGRFVQDPLRSSLGLRILRNLNRLSSWIKLAAEANSLADFEAGMGE